MNLASQTTDRRKLRKLLVSMGAGAVTGALATIALLHFADSEWIGGLGTSREIAALVGLVYIVTALAVGIGVSRPRFGALYLNAEDPEELREQKTLLALSSLSMAAIGFALEALAFARPAGPIPPAAALVATLFFLALAVWLSLRQARLMDEFMRDLGRESAALSFYLLFLVGGGWSILAHLDLVAAPAPLDWLSLFAALLLVGTFAVCGKKGLLKPR